MSFGHEFYEIKGKSNICYQYEVLIGWEGGIWGTVIQIFKGNSKSSTMAVSTGWCPQWCCLYWRVWGWDVAVSSVDWYCGMGILAVIQVNALVSLVFDCFPNLASLAIMNFSVAFQNICFLLMSARVGFYKADWYRMHTQVSDGNCFLESSLWPVVFPHIICLWNSRCS